MVAVGGAEAGVDDAPAVGVLGQRQALAELEARPEVLGGGVELVAFEVQLGQADVHVGGAAQRPVRRGEVESGGEGALGGAEAALGDLHVGEAEGAAEDVGEVLGRFELGDGGGVLASAGFEVAVGPLGEPDQGGGGAAAEVVVVGAEAGGPFAVGDGAGEVAAQQREAGAVHGGLRGQPAELDVVVHDHVVLRPIRVEPALRSSSRSSSTPSMSPVTMWAPTSPRLRTGRFAKTSGGRASSQARRVASWRACRRAGMASSTSSAAAVKSSAAMAWRIASGRSPSASNQSLARRCRSATRSGCSSARRARSTSPNRWW